MIAGISRHSDRSIADYGDSVCSCVRVECVQHRGFDAHISRNANNEELCDRLRLQLAFKVGFDSIGDVHEGAVRIHKLVLPFLYHQIMSSRRDTRVDLRVSCRQAVVGPKSLRGRETRRRERLAQSASLVTVDQIRSLVFIGPAGRWAHHARIVAVDKTVIDIQRWATRSASLRSILGAIRRLQAPQRYGFALDGTPIVDAVGGSVRDVS